MVNVGFQWRDPVKTDQSRSSINYWSDALISGNFLIHLVYC
jgi:hypothetical protein